MTTEDSVKKLVEQIYKAGSSVGKTETVIRHEIAELLTTFKDQCVREERERKIGEYGFYDLVEMIKEILEHTYPLDVFDGSSGDTGPLFTSKLHEAMSLLTSKDL